MARRFFLSSNQTGLVLINALLLVTALAAVAVLLLQRGQDARLRQHAIQDTAQTQAYLDGAEALVIQILRNDRQNSAADHLGEAWAQDNYTVPIDRGQVSIHVHDLQARYSLSWLQGGEGAFGAEMFERLLEELGLPSTLRADLQDYMANGGPEDKTPYRLQWPPINPSGGALVIPEDLLVVKGMTAQHYARLRPFITVISREPILNINTTPRAILRAALPDLPPGAVDALLAQRKSEPFETDEDLALWFSRAISDQDEGASAASQFGVTSHWFAADVSAQLNRSYLPRRLVLRRARESGKTYIEQRFAVHP